MRTLFSAPLTKNVSALGFGSASLGSRVSAKNGRKALEKAFETGVTWYDTAPPYGDGEAEAILGGFLIGKRERVSVCTKTGIPRPDRSVLKRYITPIFRPAIELAPQLRSRIGAARRTSERPPITAKEIEKSVTESLRRLSTSYVDILALHDPTPTEAADPAICEQLQRMVDKGYTRAVGIAGDLESSVAGLDAFPGYSFVQLSDGPFIRNVDRLRATRLMSRPLLIATHSVLGVKAALTRMEAAIAHDPELRRKLRYLVNADDNQLAHAILLDYAFANNPDGIVLLSMYRAAHFASNVSRANLTPNLNLKIQLDRLLTDGRAGFDMSN